MWCWKDGEYIKDTELRISPFDHGFLYGIGFFETFRTYSGEPFLFEEHMARLQQALNEYHIVLPYSVEQLKDVIYKLTALSDGREGYFRLNISAGDEGLGLQANEYLNPTVILFRKELVAGPKEKSATLLQTVRSMPEQKQRYKSHHYANNILARQELPSLKEQEGIFLNAEGFIAEGITSNVFWVKEGCVYTPSVRTGILNGITRQFVLQLAQQLKLVVVEGEFFKEAILEAEECFITTSIQEIIPINQLEDSRFKGMQGPIYEQLHQAYKRYRGVDAFDTRTL